MEWNWVDLVLGLLVISALAGGYRRGLTQIVSGWLGLIIGFLAAVLFFKPLKIQMLVWFNINQPTAAGSAGSSIATTILSALITVVAFALIIAAVNLLFRLIGRGVHKIMETIGLAWVDGILGALITLSLAVVVIALLVGMGKPLLEMGSAAHFKWALTASNEMNTSRLQVIFLQVYQQWGSWVNGRI